MIALRREHIVFRRTRFFHGRLIPGTEIKDVVWLRPDGEEMAEDDWSHAGAKALGLRLSGEAGLMHVTERGEQEPDDTFLIFMNASHEDVPFLLPSEPSEAGWQVLIDTGSDGEADRGELLGAGTEVPVVGHSLQLLILAAGFDQAA